jgi:hypothetical protein
MKTRSERARIMTEKRLSAGSIAKRAWHDGFGALGALRGVTFAAFLGLLLVDLLVQFWQPASTLAAAKPGFDTMAAAARGGLLALGGALVQALLLTPLALAIHRFILLGERTPSYRLEFGLRRFRRFALYTFLLQLIALSPSGLMFLSFGLAKMMPPVAMALLFLGACLVVIAGVVVGLILTVRLTLLFPAVAVDAPRAGWNRALDESSGRFWHILAVVLLTGLIGFLILIIPSAGLQGLGAYLVAQGHRAPGILITSLTQAGASTLMAAALVSAASWLYRDSGDPVAPEVLAAD